MSDCELMTVCIFFNDKMASKPGTATLLKNKYCEGDFKNCARYMVCKKLGREAVPSDMFPNQSDRALQLLGG